MTDTPPQQEVSSIHTACRNCVFAEFKNKVQTGCSLNKLDDYRNAGIDLVEVYDKDGTEFFLVDGRFCLFYRNKEIMERYPRDSWERIALMTTKCPYHAMVLFEEEHTFAQLKRTLKNLRHDQEIAPNFVTVLNKQYLHYAEKPEKYTKPSVLLDLLNDLEFHQFSFKNVYDPTLGNRELIDLSFDSSSTLPYPFYAVFHADFDIPHAFSKELNDAILIKMMQIGIGTPEDKLNGMIVSRTAHKKHGGNAFNINLEDKIEKYEENAHNFIHKASDICPSLIK